MGRMKEIWAERQETGKRTCYHCKKTLKVIGEARKNGDQDKEDSDDRYYHLKCKKRAQEIRDMKELIERNL